MKRFPEIDLAEEVAPRYLVGKVPQVGEGEEVQLGLKVEQAEVPDRAEGSIGFWREM